MSVEKQKTVYAGSSHRVGISPAKSVHTPSSGDSLRKSGFKSKSANKSLRSRLGPATVLERPSPSEIRVYNDAGEDVTPKPLLQIDRHSAKGQHAVIMAESPGATPIDASQSSFYQGGTLAAGLTTAGPFTRSVFSGSISGRSTDIFSDDFGDSPLEASSTWIDMKVEYKREYVTETLTEEEIEVPVEITLTETDMISMLELPAISVTSDSREGKRATEANLQYQELVKGKSGNSDRYTDRGMNTFNEPPKNKSTLTVAVTRKECAVQASESDIFDTNNISSQKAADKKTANSGDDIILVSSEGPAAGPAVELKPGSAKDPDAVGARPSDVPGTVRTSTEGGREATMSSMAIGESIFGARETKESAKEVTVDTSPDEERILKSDSFQRHLVIMERIVNLNTYQPKLAAYRNFPNLSVDQEQHPTVEADKVRFTGRSSQKVEAVTDLGPSLDRLWSYQCSLTKGRNVSCIAWNRVNPDLVAVGYGQFEYSKQKTGLVCCWSFKNPEFPERVYETSGGVLSVDFSQSHPNLLAVGMYSGAIAIYNVGLSNKDPILDSLEASGKHIGPVWQLCWIEKERGKGEERTEVLVSISADGRVTQWAIRKGFESYDLIKLKRLTTKQTTTQGKQKKSEAYISKYAAGLCFNFSSRDSNIYLAGTEDGYIHKCSCSYNEQYLDSYSGHTGPVYGVSWSPYDDNIFLSCSADWSIRLWHQERLQPILNLFSSTKAVHSISWSPKSSTVFACVNEGALEVWDLSQNTLDPILQNTPSAVDIKLSSVSFARNSDCLLVGDSEGQVTVYQLRGMPVIHANQVEALHQIINSSISSQLGS